MKFQTECLATIHGDVGRSDSIRHRSGPCQTPVVGLVLHPMCTKSRSRSQARVSEEGGTDWRAGKI